MKKLIAGCLYFQEMRLNKIALHSYITKSNSHQVIDEDKNKQKYGNKPEMDESTSRLWKQTEKY